MAVLRTTPAPRGILELAVSQKVIGQLRHHGTDSRRAVEPGTAANSAKVSVYPNEAQRRIVVTGMAGSGKSTFSRALAARSGLPLIHLDLHFWKAGWTEPSEAEWREKQRGLLADDAWIADGNYTETLDLRLERADTVVVLATPWWRCAGRALLRGCRMPDKLPEGCEYSAWQRLRDEWRLIPVIWRNRRTELEREQAIIARQGQHATCHVLTSKQAIREFLDGSVDVAGRGDRDGDN